MLRDEDAVGGLAGDAVIGGEKVGIRDGLLSRTSSGGLDSAGLDLTVLDLAGLITESFVSGTTIGT